MRLGRSKSPEQTRRRQRQLPNEAPPASFSYSSNRSGAARDRQAQRGPEPTSPKTGHIWPQRLGLIILSLVIVASAVKLLSLASSATVLPLNTADSQSFLRPTSTYEAAVNQQLKGSIWNHNKLTVDTAKISQNLKQQFPELSSASVTVPLLAHRPLVYVGSAKPSLVLVTSNGSFLVDNTGKALVKAPNLTDLNQPGLPVVNDQNKLNIQLQHQALPASDVSFIQTVITQLAAKQHKVASLSLPAGTSELDVQLAGQPYIVKFNLQSDKPTEQAGTFLATIAGLRRQNVTPVKYVDVRVEGRAYYQ